MMRDAFRSRLAFWTSRPLCLRRPEPRFVAAGQRMDGAAICGTAGECRRVGREEAREIFQSGKALVAHAAFVAGRLKAPATQPLYDVLELFAFVRPGLADGAQRAGLGPAL